MPDQDMGTARAHIKVDGDSRGADQATRAVDGFSRALEFIANHLGKFVAAMDKIEGELHNVEGDFKDAASAADKYDRAVDGITATHIKASRSTHDFARNVEDLHSRLKFAHDAWANYAIPVLTATKAIRAFNKEGGGLKGILAGMKRAGVAGAAISALRNHFLGMGKALRQAPAWQQQIARVAQNVALFTLAGKNLSRVIRPLENGFLRLIRGAEGADFAIAGFRHALDSTIGSASRFFTVLDRIPVGAYRAVGGLALMRSGMRGLQGRFAPLITGFRNLSAIWKTAILGTLTFGPAIFEALAHSLTFVSNALVGLWSGIKQLSGGFLALPGLFATAGAAIVPLVGIVKTLKSNFKDLISAVNANDPEKFAEAMAKIPPYLRPLAQAVADIIPKFKDFGNILTATFVSGGLETQLRNLANTWLPAIATGADQVANSWKTITNDFAAFLGQSRTISDVNQVFMNTSQIMNTVSSSIQPILQGLRDLGVVGSTFIRNLAETYLPGIADKFASWAANARQSGQAMQWMENSVTAVKDLWHGMDQLVRATWTILTLFKTGSGENFLDHFASSMKKFNDIVQRSATSGMLKQIGDSVRNIGTEHIKEFVEVFKSVAPTIGAALRFIAQMSTAFSSTFLPVIKLASSALKLLLDGLNALGGGAILGSILGIIGAIKVLGFVLGPMGNIIKIAFGAFNVVEGVNTLVIGLAGTLEKLGPAGRRASAGLLSVGDSMAGIIGKATLVGAAGLAIWEVMSTGAEEMKASARSISDASKHAKEGISDLRKAFYTDEGTTGPTVIAQLATNAKQDMDDLQNVSDKAPGVAAKITDFITQGFGNVGAIGIATSFFRGTSDGLQNLENKANDAKSTLSQTNDALSKLGATSGDLSKYIYGSNDAFAQFTGTLSQAGASGAIEYWSKLRDQFMQLQREMEAAGPGAVMVANGIDKIANSGGNATTKLDGLKLALQGLGLLKEDQYEAALNFAKAIDNLGDAAAKAADKSQPLKDILDPNTGILNPQAGVNAQNLYNQVQPIAQAFLHAAASGQDLSAFIPKMNDNLEKLRNSFGLSKDAFDKFTASLGIDPKIVQILVQLQGKDKVLQGIGAILVEAEANLNNTKPLEIPVGIDAPNIAKQINDLFNNPNAVGTNGQNVVLHPGIDQGALDKLEQFLAGKGIQIPGGPSVPPGATAQIPAATVPVPAPAVPVPGTPPTPGNKAPVALPPGTQLPASMLPPQGVPSAPSAVAPLDKAPPLTPGPPPVAPPPGQPAPATQQGVNIGVKIDGLDKFDKLQDYFKKLNDTLVQNIGQWNAWSAGVNGALVQTLTSVQQVMDAIAKKATEGGKAFSKNFAAGITDQAGLQAISDAAIKAMQTAADKLPHSPAKEGPLSGAGWSGHSGSAFSGDFARGILGGQGQVGEAASKVAGKAAGALKPATPYGNFNFNIPVAQFKDLKDIANIVAHGIGLAKTVTGLVGDVAKFADDPFGAKKAAAADLGEAGGGAGILNQGASALAGVVNPSKKDIASAIAGEAASRGYDKNTAIAVISAAMKESGIDPNVTNATGHHGLFQQSKDKPSQADASQQIQWMFSQLDALGGPAAAKADPLDLIATQIEKGGYGGGALAQHSAAATTLYNQALKTGGLTPGGKGPYIANPASTAATGAPAGAAPNENALRQWAQAMFGIPNTFGTGSWENAVHPADQGWHGKGFGFDFAGTKPQMAAMANYIAKNLSSQTLELIYQGKGFDPKDLIKNTKFGDVYGPDTLAGHADHVHWATDVAPILAGANANALPWAAGGAPETKGQPTGFGPQEQKQPGDKEAIGAPGQQRDISAGKPLQPGQQGAQAGVIEAGEAQKIQDISKGGGGGDNKSPLAQAQAGLSKGMDIASDFVKTFQAWVDAVSATKYIEDQLVRGISSTEDIYKLVDQFQKYITFAAQIASTVGDIAGMASGASGGADMGGAAAASQAAKLISTLLTAINTGIDIAQEAYRIWGSYFGQFLGFLTGGPGGMMGDVHFLLDQNTGQLLAYSGDNPMKKVAHNLPGAVVNPAANNQVVGQLNYYAGPAEDPRVGVRNMMYQVRSTQLSTVTAQ